MSVLTLRSEISRRFAFARDKPVVLAVFTGTLFLSALLLFSIQPMFAKMVLPKLGGSPSVWAVSMCFFQAALLAGYLYAYALNRFMSPRHAPFVHLALLAVALLALPIALPQGWSEPPAGDAYLWLSGLLAVGVGLPFFAVSANAPLLQAWFSRSGHPHAADPYFLYGASNLGSLIALLSYPVLMAPVFGLATQASLWTAGFVLLVLAIALCAALMLMNHEVSAPQKDQTSDFAANPDKPAAALHWRQRAHWIALAFVPSGLLVAFTSFVTTDIVSAPFLWVVPLAIFLGTFILVFRDKPLIPHKYLLRAQPLLVIAVFFGIGIYGATGWLIGVVAGFGAFFVTTMVCHKELYDRRPDVRNLTEFYLWMSFGGVLGGIFAAIIAPQIFSSIYEYPLLLAFGIACRPGVFTSQISNKEARRLRWGIALAFTGIALLLKAMGPSIGLPVHETRNLVFILLAALAVLSAAHPPRELALITAAAMALFILPSGLNAGDSERSFFGVHRVADVDGKVRKLSHGMTLHGAQRLQGDADGKVTVTTPLTYYYPGSPMVQGVAAARQVSGKTTGKLNVAIIGLGAGAMACNAKPGENWQFFEIDPVVVKIASDPKRFTYLSSCQPNAAITVGDARLTVAKLAPQSLDYLLVDAFSSDAVPVHLLTLEAFRMYLDKLAPNGILAMHISNRHLELASVIAAAVERVPEIFALHAADRVKRDGYDRIPSEVIYVAKSAQALEPLKKLHYVAPLQPTGATAWTDDYSNILAAIWRKMRQK